MQNVKQHCWMRRMGLILIGAAMVGAAGCDLFGLGEPAPSPFEWPLVAVAGESRPAYSGETVQLYGASIGGHPPCTYAWEQVSGEPVELVQWEAQGAVLVAPRVTTPTPLEFLLRVVDSAGEESTSRTTITVYAEPPSLEGCWSGSGELTGCNRIQLRDGLFVGERCYGERDDGCMSGSLALEATTDPLLFFGVMVAPPIGDCSRLEYVDVEVDLSPDGSSITIFIPGRETAGLFQVLDRMECPALPSAP